MHAGGVGNTHAGCGRAEGGEHACGGCGTCRPYRMIAPMERCARHFLPAGKGNAKSSAKAVWRRLCWVLLLCGIFFGIPGAEGASTSNTSCSEIWQVESVAYCVCILWASPRELAPSHSGFCVCLEICFCLKTCYCLEMTCFCSGII